MLKTEKDTTNFAMFHAWDCYVAYQWIPFERLCSLYLQITGIGLLEINVRIGEKMFTNRRFVYRFVSDDKYPIPTFVAS